LVIVLADYEKRAFLKFFFTYFISVAVLILAAGYFYFEQMKLQLIKQEHFSLIEYARHLKMGQTTKEFSKDYHHRFVITKQHIDIKNFQREGNEFVKYIPTMDKQRYLEVFKSVKHYQQTLHELKLNIILVQLLLLGVFGIISFLLAKNALSPLQKGIETLDKFAKDLIHDLNTPVSAMKLNLTILQKNVTCKEQKAFLRLQKSVQSIIELQKSLTVLLENKTFQKTQIDICRVVEDVIELQKSTFLHVNFRNNCFNFKAVTNEEALKQILQNLVTNAAKYNSNENASVNIYNKGNILYIEDNGDGIEDIQKIFTREYSMQNSSGLGLDIVKRLCDATSIKIQARSLKQGSVFSLEF